MGGEAFFFSFQGPFRYLCPSRACDVSWYWQCCYWQWHFKVCVSLGAVDSSQKNIHLRLHKLLDFILQFLKPHCLVAATWPPHFSDKQDHHTQGQDHNLNWKLLKPLFFTKFMHNTTQSPPWPLYFHSISGRPICRQRPFSRH